MKIQAERRKKISAGVIVTDAHHLLLGHVTGSRFWDIPKGQLDPNEEELDAAVRELHEETSMQVDPGQFVHLGRFVYKKNKDLSLWLYQTVIMPDPCDLECLSTFDSGNGVLKTEMDGFGVFTWNRACELVVPDMARVLVEVQRMVMS